VKSPEKRKVFNKTKRRRSVFSDPRGGRLLGGKIARFCFIFKARRKERKEKSFLMGSITENRIHQGGKRKEKRISGRKKRGRNKYFQIS